MDDVSLDTVLIMMNDGTKDKTHLPLHNYFHYKRNAKWALNINL